ncbi:protein kinase domain-containing protein [Streptomyces sp. TRM68416]|uniref:serine/threonine-protein kinase n=1 Tax=Streptomyces sp. TRM68416 TaxID=2758412 RepID=UPI001662192A|nr:serine/threonine-protein kinase [Streptomyces sp. TRM68416]MBD0837132.1 PQQ-binding-like beta-propeller repeat protein [Streptomyces sp. TRM68416]
MPLHKDDPKSVGGYRLVDRLGAGGMGVVYRGRSRSGREVAVKVVHAQYAEDPVFRTRFRQEIAAVRKVSGAFTASVVDADPEAGRPWMATQYVPGSSLAARVRERGPLPEDEARRLALGLVEALRDIHRAGVVHRDLKPANVLIADDGPRVIDFGISRAAENNALTETGQMIGTPPFMSPEQLTDARSVGPASDVFSLGSLLVFMLTGRGPFDADNPYLTAYRVVHTEPALGGVRQPLRAMVERCLAKAPADRPALAELARELATALPEASADDLPTVAALDETVPAPALRPVPPAPPPPPARRRRLRPLWAATGVIGALALGLTAHLLSGPGQSGGENDAGRKAAPVSRWSDVPDGWQPWQTSVYATAEQGVKKGEAVNYVGFESTQCTADGRSVYCTGGPTLPVRIDALTGRTLWRAEALPPATGQGAYDFTLLGVTDGLMLVEQEHRTEVGGDKVTWTIAALDARTGERLWHRVVKPDQVRPHLFGDTVLAPDESGRSVTARSPRTGAARWTAPLPVGDYCTPADVGRDIRLMCAPGMTSTPTMRLLRLDRSDGSSRSLTVPRLDTLVGTDDGRLLFLDVDRNDHDGLYSRIRLVDPDSGEADSTELAQKCEKPVALADGTLWCATSSGQVTAVSVRTGKQLWRTATSLEQPGTATYDPRARVVYLSSAGGRVAALDARRGTLLWETLPRAERVTGGSQTQVLLHQGALVVATPEGDIFTLDPAHPDRKPVSG